MVAQDEGNEKEGNPQEDSHSGDEIDKVVDLLGYWCLAGLDARGEAGNAAHHGVVPNIDDTALAGALHSVGGEKGQVLGLQRVLVGELGGPQQRLRLAS